MTIREVRCHRVHAPLHTPFVTAVRRTEAVDTVLVEVRDDDGHSGWGEGVETWRITGESVAGIEAAINGPLQAAVVGASADEVATTAPAIAAAVVGNTAAKSALDCALHDLAARRLGVPLARLFGGSARPVGTDVTIAVGPVEEMAQAAADRIADGFAALKIKVGDGGDDDIDRLRAIRAAAPAALIRIDANQGWQPKQAVRIIGTLEDLGLDIELVEQPVSSRDLAGLAFVTANVGTPVLADESIASPADAIEIIRRRAADLLNIKLAKTGGLWAARRVAEVAAAAEVGVLFGSMMETHVGIAAVASLAGAVGGPWLPDLDAAWWLRSSPVTGGVSYSGASVVLPDEPGIGVTGIA